MLYHMALVTTITPEPGAVEMTSRYVLDRDHEIEGGLPENFVTQEICLVCLKPYSAFGSGRWPKGRFFWGVVGNTDMDPGDDKSAHESNFLDYVRRTRMFTPDGVTHLSRTHRMPLPWHEIDDYRQKPFPWISTYIGSWLEASPPQFSNFCSNDRFEKTVI